MSFVCAGAIMNGFSTLLWALTYGRCVMQLVQLLYAGWMLGWSLVKTTFVRAFGGGDQGLATFHRKFEPDRLVALTPSQRDLLPVVSGCIACARCDDVSSGKYGGMMSVVLAASRSMPEFDAASIVVQRLVDELSPQDWDTMHSRCPARIPFDSLVAFVQSSARQLPQVVVGSKGVS